MIVVGQAPGSRTNPAEPLSGASGRRLANLCELPLNDFLLCFERVNLLASYPGPNGKGDAFFLTEARAAAAALIGKIATRKFVVLLGLNVARAFGHRAPWFAWRDAFKDSETWIAVAPHPSGISHWWNDPRNVRQAREFWRYLAFNSASRIRSATALIISGGTEFPNRSHRCA